MGEACQTMRTQSVPGSAIAIVLALSFPASSFGATITERNGKMGSRFELTVVHESEVGARKALAAGWAEIDRIEAMISSWRDDSETSEINRNAGLKPVVVSQELFNLIRRSLRVSKLTDGAFDITFDTVGRYWNFKKKDAPLPDEEQIATALVHTGYQHVFLDPDLRSVSLATPDTRIGFGAIGKGFAANRVVFVLKDHGVTGGIVNAGGDLVIFGVQEDDTPWRIGIANPLDRDTVFAYLDVTEMAVVTSGDYENFIEIDGVRYSHIIDPRTGRPVQEVRSVTVVCPDGELADALATGVSVLGVENGLKLINRLNGIEAMLVDREGKIHFSNNLQGMLKKD